MCLILFPETSEFKSNIPSFNHLKKENIQSTPANFGSPTSRTRSLRVEFPHSSLFHHYGGWTLNKDWSFQLIFCATAMGIMLMIGPSVWKIGWRKYLFFVAGLNLSNVRKTMNSRFFLFTRILVHVFSSHSLSTFWPPNPSSSGSLPLHSGEWLTSSSHFDVRWFSANFTWFLPIENMWVHFFWGIQTTPISRFTWLSLTTAVAKLSDPYNIDASIPHGLIMSCCDFELPQGKPENIINGI